MFPLLTVQDEIVVECNQQNAQAVEKWLVSCMIEGMASVLGEEPRIESAIMTNWAGKKAE